MKYIKFALLALITFSMCLAGCSDLLLEKDNQQELSQVFVSLKDEDGNSRFNGSRTIYPTTDGIVNYRIIYTPEPASGNTQTAPEPTIIYADINGYIEPFIVLPRGNWIINASVQLEIEGEYLTVISGSAPLNVRDNQHQLDITIKTPAPGEGTFKYIVSYPVSGTATITLSPIVNGTIGEPVVNTTAVNNIESSAIQIDSGFYYLRVSATSGGTTVTRSEIVHIWPHMETKPNYVFSKLDFGANYLTLSGEVKVLNNGVQPLNAYLGYRLYKDTDGFDYYNWYDTAPIYFDGSGNGTWSIGLSDLWNGSNTIVFYVIIRNERRIAGFYRLPVEDKDDYDLGTHHFEIDETIIFSLEEWLWDKNYGNVDWIGYPFQKSGDSLFYIDHSGILVYSRQNDWDSFDIDINNLGMNPAYYIYQITVRGEIYDTGGMKLQIPISPWTEFAATEIDLPPGYFELVLDEIPGNYQGDSIRLTTNQDNTMDYKITFLEIRFIEQRDEPWIPEGPAFEDNTVVPYIVPTQGVTNKIFYLDLNNSLDDIYIGENPHPRANVWTSADNVKYAFSELNAQKVAVRLTNAQRDLVYAYAQVPGNIVRITIDGEADPDSTMRYFLGRIDTGSNWNATQGSGSSSFSYILDTTQSFNTGRPTEYFILDLLEDTATVVTINSIKIELIGDYEPQIVFSVPFNSATNSLNFGSTTVKNIEPWYSNYNDGIVVNITGSDFDVTKYSHIKITANFYDEYGELKNPIWGDIQFRFFAEEVTNANGSVVSTQYNFGVGDTSVSNPGFAQGSRIITYPIPGGAKPDLWGFGVQSSSNDPLNIMFVEITAVEFIPGELCVDCGEYPCVCDHPELPGDNTLVGGNIVFALASYLQDADFSEGVPLPLVFNTDTVITNGGLNFNNRTEGWQGLDINIKDAPLSLDIVNNIYKIKIEGHVLGKTPPGASIVMNESNEPWNWIVPVDLESANEEFSFEYEFPANYYTNGHEPETTYPQVGVRIHTNDNGATMSFRITSIIIEYLGPREVEGSTTIGISFAGFGEETFDITDSPKETLQTGDTLSVSVSGVYDYIICWNLDGREIYGYTDDFYDLYIDDSFGIGVHDLTVIVIQGGNPYSKSVTFRVAGN